MNLSILCVTKGEPFAQPYLAQLGAEAGLLGAQLVIIQDNGKTGAIEPAPRAIIASVTSRGYIESVLDQALEYCTEDYVLRIDDDEAMSPAMFQWVQSGRFQTADHWKFPRYHLWGDERHYLNQPNLFPDHQTRLSVRELAGHRTSIHAGSPYGGGTTAPVALLHYKFLCKSREERRAIWDRYERLQTGAGLPMKIFSEPEAVLTDFPVLPVNDGTVPV